MKDSASYNKLWQAKMQDLPLEGDANTAWQKMLGSLDENMPVIKPVPGAAKPWSFIGSKFLIAIIAVVAAVSIIYFAYHINAVHPKAPVKPDSKSTGQIDSSTQPAYKTDSASNHIKTITQKSKAENNPASPGSDTNNPNTVSKKENLNDTKNSNHSTTNNNVNAGTSMNNAASAQMYKKTYSSGNSRRRKSVSGSNTDYSVPNKTTANQEIASGSEASVNNVNTGKTSSGVKAVLSNNTNGNLLANKTTDSAAISTKNDLSGSIKSKDSVTTQNKPVQQSSTDIPKGKISKPGSVAKSKVNNKNKKSNGNSGFELELKTGFNTNKNTSVVPMLGIAGAYYFTPKFSVDIGANILSYRLVEGGYSNSNYPYTTVGDSDKITHHIADKLTIANTAKIYTIDIPIMADYRITNWLSVKAGPVISIPLKKPTINSVLSPISNPADTLSAYHTIVSATNNSTLKNDVNIGFSGMLTLSFQRFNINGGYLQSLGQYTIGSSLGKTNVYYHSFHLGISYLIFQPKKKKKK